MGSQCQLVIDDSQPEEENSRRGIRLIRKVVLIDLVAFEVKLVSGFRREKRMGRSSKIKISKVTEGIMLIAFIWSCTNFLVPKTNGILLSYKSKKAVVF